MPIVFIPARRSAAALLLLGTALAGCKNTPTTADNSTSPVNASVAGNMAGADAPPEPGSMAAGGQAMSVTIAPPPVPAAATPAAAAAPLMDAAVIAHEIDSGKGVTRERHGDGWAWRRNGAIVRTASADGGEVAYYRAGQDAPFLVQHGDRSYGYDGGKVTHRFDARGRADTPDANARRDAQQFADRARHSRAGASPAPAATDQPRTAPDAHAGHRRADGAHADGDRGRTQATMHDNGNTPTDESGAAGRRP